ncbi:MAG: hypothetical protein AAF721_30875 [Myxococcota bacterium]
MASPTSRTVLLPALIALAVGCDGEGCSRCQNAIDHMAAKIEMFNCNPGQMENAREEIDEACSASSRHIGILVEECNAGEGLTVTPSDKSANMRIEFTVDPVVVQGEPLSVELRDRESFTGRTLPNGEFDLDFINGHVWTGELVDESVLSVRVIERDDPEAEVTVGTSQVFIRTAESYWTNFPVRTITLTESDDGLLVLDFLNFQ